MSFEDYMKAVVDYYMMGGTTWEASYMRVLEKERPELAEQIKRTHLDPALDYAKLGDFLHLVFKSWSK